MAGFHAVTNPRWQNFKNLFRFIDVGNETHGIPKYNGGLFAPHAVDELELPDDPWTNFFHTISTYDFADEVNLDVLGHLFERSITELEKLKESGLFGGDAEKAQQYATMPQSAKRKQLGIYYTPPELTSRIVQYTVEELIAQRFAAAAVEFGVSEEGRADRGIAPDDAEYWRRCLAILRNLKIVDPACGSGAFLFQAYDVLERRYNEVIGHLEQVGDARRAKTRPTGAPVHSAGEPLRRRSLARSGRDHATGPLDSLGHAGPDCWPSSRRTSSTATRWFTTRTVHPAGFDWRERFPDVFDREESGFDCVIGNPPWERIKLQEREFFSLPAPEIATATNAAKRGKLVAKLEADESRTCIRRYQAALRRRACPARLLPQERPISAHRQGRHQHLRRVRRTRLPTRRARTAASDCSFPRASPPTRRPRTFFAAIAESNRLIRLYDFENQEDLLSRSPCVVQVLHPQLRRRTGDYARRPISSSSLTASKNWRTAAAHCASAAPTSAC